MTLPAQNIATNSTFCSNPNCNEQFDLDKATAEIQKSGIVYADCDDFIYQGYKCTNPDCRALRFITCDRRHPVKDNFPAKSPIPRGLHQTKACPFVFPHGELKTPLQGCQAWSYMAIGHI